MKPDFISLLRNIKTEDWAKKVNDRWTVRDMVAHMVAWERDDPKIIKESWKTKQKPWFVDNKSSDDDDFNKKALEYYKGYSSERLIEEWTFYQKKVKEVINEIGEDNLKKYPEIFGWLFDNGKDNHYSHHYRQIRNLLDRKYVEGKREDTSFKIFTTLPLWQANILKGELYKKSIASKIVDHGTNISWETLRGGAPSGNILIPSLPKDVYIPVYKLDEARRVLDSLRFDEYNESYPKVSRWQKIFAMILLLTFLFISVLVIIILLTS